MNSSSPSFESLHQLEQIISEKVKNFQLSDVQEDKIALNGFHEYIIEYSRKYNQILNKILQKYNNIDYKKEPKKKAIKKAVLGYSYHFLDLLMKILRLLESPSISAHIMDENLSLLLEYFSRKEELLNNQYYPKAQQELATFYDSELRNQMDEKLKKFLDKHKKLKKNHDLI
ncbi:MAG: hypothetical protein K9W44_04430 [Candidatus Lokiarchaeota archaeon]|nr:hypothetical protein [Candidatus Harpocratesius repetitus]